MSCHLTAWTNFATGHIRCARRGGTSIGQNALAESFQDGKKRIYQITITLPKERVKEEGEKDEEQKGEGKENERKTAEGKKEEKIQETAEA